MDTRNFTSRISFFYVLLLVAAVILSVFCINSDYEKPFGTKKDDIISSLTIDSSYKTAKSTSYTLKTREIMEKGGAIGIYIDHWDLTVLADGYKIYSRTASKSIFCNTTGSTWNIISIPPDSSKIDIVLKSQTNESFNHNIKISCGTAVKLYRSILKRSIIQMILGLIVAGIGIFLFINWVFVIRMAEKGSYIPYFATICVLLGIWTILVSEFVLLEVSNYVAVYFIGHLCLLSMSFPLVVFTKKFYKLSDSLLFKLLSIVVVVIPVVNVSLQFLGIRELRQQLPFTHLSILLAMLYMIYAILRAIFNRQLTRSMKVSVAGLFLFFVSVFFTLGTYYTVNDSTFTIPIAFMVLFCVFTWLAISMDSRAILEENRDIQIYKQLAEKDVLTGLANRNCYESTCRNTRIDGNVCVLTLDLNNLKKVNDTLGHSDGDRIICAAADSINSVFGKTGLCFRIGGDEFCIIIRNSSEETLRKQITQLRNIEAKYNLTHKDAPLYMAAGYAFFDPSKDKGIEDIRMRADKEMYADKRRSKEKIKETFTA